MKIGGILVVAQDRNVRAFICEMMEGEGCHPVFDAKDGVEALDFLAEHGSRIQVMILELALPRMSGDEVLRKLRTVYDGQLAVVVVSSIEFTATILTEIPDPCLHLGYMAMPFKVEEFMLRVESVLLRKRDAEKNPA